ncbi:hypothetical protein [Aminobacter carboxidus]|uniref:Uncharacterized protein n=1 Tax=Aminobacter carboxidus TaxID=376165 RepID=A0ABR9GXN0_9HYPH|nr:hypothetical protein [Aminobacter carboxidus]MBE1208445.1 hypothetical protein [Aminobacter carboxidus]
MSDAIYAFRRGPTYDGATQQELFDSVMAQPMGMAATIVDQAKGAALKTFGLGTAVRTALLPQEAPTVPGMVVTGEGGETTWVPDTPQMRRRRTVWGNPANVQAETAEQLQARRDAAGALDEAAYKSSPYFRDDIPWDSGMTEDRAAALAAMSDASKAREFYASKRPIAAFVGQFAGQALDPINYIPIAGPLVKAAAVARLGKIGGTALVSALDAAGSTAIFGVATAGMRGKFGDDVSWQALVSEVAGAALIGGAFGAIGGSIGKAVDRRRDTRLRLQAEQRLMTLRTTQEARIALNEAVDGLARGEDVRLSPNATEPLARIASEVESLSRAYDEVLDRPTGPVDDPLVRIEPGDIDALIVARGAFSKINEFEFSKSFKGLVKVIWAHGEKSTKDKAFRVTKDDLAALPNIVREFEPVPPDTVAAVGDTPMRTWRVERNGRVVVYGDKGFEGGQQLVTVHIDKGGPDAPKLSEKKKPAPPDSRPQVLGLAEDTAGDRSIGTPGVGQAATASSAGGQSLPATANIAQRPNIDNSVVSAEPRPAGIEQAEAAVAMTGSQGPGSQGTESLRTLAHHHGVDPDSGAFAEQADIAQLAARGRLSPGDEKAFDEAQSDFEAGSAFAEALKSVASCLT